MPMTGRVLTRQNFDDVGEWAGCRECWGLSAPSPGLFIETSAGLAKANIGDLVIKNGGGAVSVLSREPR